MYNMRLLYNTSTGDVLHIQTLSGCRPASVEYDKNYVARKCGVSVTSVGCFEWDNPENELAQLIATGRRVKVDISQTPHVLYGEETSEPSETDEISGNEFLSMVEEVL